MVYRGNFQLRNVRNDDNDKSVLKIASGESDRLALNPFETMILGGNTQMIRVLPFRFRLPASGSRLIKIHYPRRHNCGNKYLY